MLFKERKINESLNIIFNLKRTGSWFRCNLIEHVVSKFARKSQTLCKKSNRTWSNWPVRNGNPILFGKKVLVKIKQQLIYLNKIMNFEIKKDASQCLIDLQKASASSFSLTLQNKLTEYISRAEQLKKNLPNQKINKNILIEVFFSYS